MSLEITATSSYPETAPKRCKFAVTVSGSAYSSYSSSPPHWSFGDGLESSDWEPAHIYTMPGVYTVTCTVLTLDCGLNPITETGTLEITVNQSEFVGPLDKCYRIGLGNLVQGIGPTEYSGDYWPFPGPGMNGTWCEDHQGQRHNVLFDQISGTWREIGLFDGPSLNRVALTEKWTDDDSTGVAHEIPWYVEMFEDCAENEDNPITHLESYLRVRARDESKKGATGYDANGWRTGQQVDISLYMDGAQTATAECVDVAEGDLISFDKKARGNRGQIRIDFAASEIQITEFGTRYKVEDVLPGPDSLQMTEMDYQAELGSPVFWFSRGRSLLLNRATGVVAAGTVTAIAGPDGNSDSAMAFTSAINLGTVSLTSGTVLVWYQTGVAITIGGVAISLTDIGTSGSWKLGHATGVTASGALVLTPTGTGRVFDLRGYSAAISSGARSYLYDDTINNAGNNVMDGY